MAIDGVVYSVSPPLKPGESPHFNAVIYALDLLLPIVDLGQQLAFSPGGATQWLSYGLIAIGWVWRPQLSPERPACWAGECGLQAEVMHVFSTIRLAMFAPCRAAGSGTGERDGLEYGPTWGNVIKIIPRMSPDHGLTAACGHRRLPIKVTKQKTCGCETAGQGPEMPI
ncbi:hypothetical protein [Nonomuraea sp. LPB2021202275-12-8]|uniref:hypothetical protein n=1 Tax=Nonomuraea sp. LPB2021202275-12-8 TaxID=3120159 RepID=UPI00300C7458